MSSSSGEDLERRLRVLEREVERLSREVAAGGIDSAAARVLASGADRDVSDVRAELRAHTQVLNALRDTQREQGEAMRAGFARVGEQFALVNGGFRTMESKFATVNAGLAQIVGLLEGHAGPEPR